MQLVDQGDMLLLQTIHYRLIRGAILKQLPELLTFSWVIDGAKIDFDLLAAFTLLLGVLIIHDEVLHRYSLATTLTVEILVKSPRTLTLEQTTKPAATPTVRCCKIAMHIHVFKKVLLLYCCCLSLHLKLCRDASILAKDRLLYANPDRTLLW